MNSARFVLHESVDRQVYFVLRAPNNEVILTSETYPSKAVALKGVAAVRANAGTDEHYHRRVAENGMPYFVLTSANHEIIGQSELYSSKQARDEGIVAVQRNAPNAALVDQA